MTNQELSKVAQAAAYVDVLVNAGIIDKETEDFCINKIKQLLEELLKEENKTQSSPAYRGITIDAPKKYNANPFTDQISTTTGLHPDHSTITTARNM